MPTFAAFMRARKAAIMQRLLERARTLPSARTLGEVELRDNFPEMIDVLAGALERSEPHLPGAAALGALPAIHATTRAEAAYSLGEVVREYGFLRAAICDEYASHHSDAIADGRCELAAMALLNAEIDCAIADSVEHYDWRRKALRDQLVGILAHDLRSPLQAIMLSTHVLLRQEHRLGEDQLRIAARIASSASRIEALVTDLLDFARTRMGSTLPISLIEADLRRITIDALDEITAIHRDRDIRCELPTATGNYRCRIDVGRIGQAVANLIGNAVKHGHDPVVVRIHDEGDVVAITVCNHGAITPAMRRTLFEPFETGDPEHGTGLGLYITREIARAHGGEVEVAAGDDDSTTFRFALPRAGPVDTP